MKKRLLLIITVGVCFSPSLYAMGTSSGVGPYNESSAYDLGPAASACKAGLSVVAHSQQVISQNSKYLSQNGNTSSNSATNDDNN